MDAGIEFQLFLLAAMNALGLAVLLFQVVTAGAINLLFEIIKLPLKAAHGLDRLVHAVNQALTLGVVEAEFTDGTRNLYLFAPQ